MIICNYLVIQVLIILFQCAAVIDLLKKIQEESKGNDSIVIVSQWVMVLELIGKYLEEEHLTFYKFTGDTPLIEREAIVEDLNKSTTTTETKVRSNLSLLNCIFAPVQLFLFRFLVYSR